MAKRASLAPKPSSQFLLGVMVVWIAFAFVVWKVYNPVVDQSFLLVYFGLSSALAGAVWTSMRSSDSLDGYIVVSSLQFTCAGATAGLGLISPAGVVQDNFLAVSISSLLVGLFVLMADSLRAYFLMPN